jgi:hypothetical protein
MQALVPFAIGVGIGGYPTADAKNRVPVDVEFDRSYRHIEFAPGKG